MIDRRAAGGQGRTSAGAPLAPEARDERKAVVLVEIERDALEADARAPAGFKRRRVSQLVHPDHSSA
jgi:hypothetical protein